MKSLFRGILAVIALFSLSLIASAQTTRIEMSLSECVAFAQENSPLLLTLQPKLQSLDLDYSVARQAFLPSLNASIGENFSFGRAQGRDNIVTNTSNASTSFSIGAEMPIFSGGENWYQLQKSRAALDTKGYIIADVEDNIALRVAESYIQLLLSKQLAATARENLALTEKYFNQVKQQVAVGKAAPADQIDIESQIARDQLSVTETEADVVRSLRILLLDMGMDLDKVREGELDIAEISPEMVVANLEKVSPNRVDTAWVLPATARLEKDLENAAYDAKIARSGYFPRLSLSAGYSNGYYYNLDEEYKSANIPFKDQIKDNGRFMVGVSLSIPIYNRGQVQRATQMADLQLNNLRGQLIQKRFDDNRNIQLARTDLEKATEQYRVSKENLELATQALKVADAKYSSGRMNTYEWEQVKNRRLQAQATYLQAIYMRLLRTINLIYFNTGEIPTQLASF